MLESSQAVISLILLCLFNFLTFPPIKYLHIGISLTFILAQYFNFIILYSFQLCNRFILFFTNLLKKWLKFSKRKLTYTFLELTKLIINYLFMCLILFFHFEACAKYYIYFISPIIPTTNPFSSFINLNITYSTSVHFCSAYFRHLNS